MPPWSWISAIVERSERNGLIGVSIQSASRCPPSVVTSSPTTTSNDRPRSRAMARPATAASMRSWSVIAITSSSVLRSTWSRISTTPAVPSDARVWMCRSPARAARSSGGLRRAVPARGRGPPRDPARAGGRRPATARAPPRCGARTRAASSRRYAVDALAARALGRERHGLDAAVVDARGSIAPDAEDVRRDAGVHRQQGRAGGSGDGAPKNSVVDPAAGDVAVAEQADRAAALEGLRAAASRRTGSISSGPARSGSRRGTPAAPGSAMRLRRHGRGAPGACRGDDGRQLEPAHVQADEERPPVGSASAASMTSGVSMTSQRSR